jgi:hypothetical protein
MKPRFALFSLFALAAIALPIFHIANAETTTDTQVSQANNVNPQTCGVYLSLPDYLCRNVDDDQAVEHADYEKWDIEHVPSENENDLKEVIVSGTAGPTGGTLTLEIISGGAKINNKIWLDNKKEQEVTVLSWPVSANSSFSQTLYIEGYENSDSVGDVKLRAKIICPAGIGVDGLNYSAASAEDVQETTVYEVDLDADSLNDNEDPYSASGFTDAEDKIEFSDKILQDGLKRPGKVVLAYPKMNSDGDLVPDFADGFNLDVGERAISDLSDVTDDLKFVPVQIQLKKPFDPATATIKFEYEVSKPEVSDEGIEITGAGTDEEPYKFTLKKGGMRLWKKKAEQRTTGSNAPDGDFIPANEDIKWSDIASDSGRTATLYIEYVDTKEREAIGRKAIRSTVTAGSVNCTDEIVVTLLPMEVALVEMTPEGGLIQQTDTFVEMNEAAPQFEITIPTISGISYGPNGLAGQLALSGTVKSKSCDAVMGELGTIKEIEVSAKGTDGYEDANITVNTVVSKGAGGDGVFAYPFTGQIQLPASPVGMTEGVNVITVQAMDPISLEVGKTSLAYNVTAVRNNGGGGGGSLPQFGGAGLWCKVISRGNDDAIEQAIIGYQILGQAPVEHELFETELVSDIYTDEEEDFKIRVELKDGVLTAYLSREAWGIEELEIPLKLVEDTGTYEGLLSAVSVAFAEGVENPGFSQILLSQPRKVGESGEGEAKVYAVRLPGFENLDPKIIEKYELNWGPDAETKYKLIKHEETGAILFENPVRPGFPLTVLPRPSYGNAAAEIAAAENGSNTTTSEAPPVENGGYLPEPNRAKIIRDEVINAVLDEGLAAAQFYAGYQAGLYEGGADLVLGTGKVWWQGVNFAGEELASGVAHLEFIVADLNWFGYGKHKERIRIQIDLADKDLAERRRATADTAKAVYNLLEWLAEAGADRLISLYLRPVSADQADWANERLGEKGQVILELLSFLLNEAKTTWVNATSYERGRYLGIVVFEVASSFIAVSKVSKLGKLSKADILLQFAKRKPRLPGGEALATKADELGKALKASGMCFVAGTMVLTAEGNVPIEKIEQGTLVWSRSDETGDMGWKRVIETFITHPSELVTVDIDVNGDGKSDDVISGTAEHPFWEVTSAKWVEMGRLKPDDHLLNSKGQSTAHILATRRQLAPADGDRYTTYNFEVEDYHTYFVGHSSIWVHNTGCSCEDALVLLRSIIGSEKNVAKTYKRLLELKPDISEQRKAEIVHDLTKNADAGGTSEISKLVDAEKIDPQEVKLGTEIQENGVPKLYPKELFSASRFHDAIPDVKLVDRAPKIRDANGNVLPGGDFIDDAGNIWDAVGPMSYKAGFQKPESINQFIISLKEHIDIMGKGNPIIDLAGMPDTLKRQVLDAVKDRFVSPDIKYNTKLVLTNNKTCVILND